MVARRVVVRGIQYEAFLAALWNNCDWSSEGVRRFQEKHDLSQPTTTDEVITWRIHSVNGLSPDHFIEDLFEVLGLVPGDFDPAKRDGTFDPSGYNKLYGRNLAERIVEQLHRSGSQSVGKL